MKCGSFPPNRHPKTCDIIDAVGAGGGHNDSATALFYFFYHPIADRRVTAPPLPDLFGRRAVQGLYFYLSFFKDLFKCDIMVSMPVGDHCCDLCYAPLF